MRIEHTQNGEYSGVCVETKFFASINTIADRGRMAALLPRESIIVGGEQLFKPVDNFFKQMRKKLLTRCRGAGIIIGTKEAERCPLSPPDLVPKG